MIDFNRVSSKLSNRCNFISIMLCIELFRHNAIIPHTVSLVTNLVVHLVRRVTVVASQSLLMW